MSPIHIGIVGLSSKPSGAGGVKWAEAAHLPTITKHPGFELVAIANSSAASAQKAKEVHHLAESVKTYGSAEELANDPNVDLVIVCVDLKRHYDVAKPALLAGKDVFIEWPFANTIAEAEELTQLANEKGVRGLIGAQARADPILKKIKELVNNRSIGEITSSTVVANYGSPLGRVDAWIAGWEQFLHIEEGSNSLSTGLGHFLNCFMHVIGDVPDVKALLHTRYKSIDLIDGAGNTVEKGHPRTSPDHLAVQAITASGAVVSITFRSVLAPARGLGMQWWISGTKGEILIETPEWFWGWDQSKATIKIRREAATEDEIVDFAENSAVADELSFMARNVGREYDVMAAGEYDRIASFEEVLATQKLLDRILKASKQGGK